MADRTSEQVLEWLRRGLDFEVVRDLRFDLATGKLDFRSGDDPVAMTRSVTVVPDHRRGFADAFEQGRAPVDFQALNGELQAYFRLVAEGSGGGLARDRGVLIRLDAPNGARPEQAPAADVGMANAMVAHELKQPLFTIAMAAKSIEFMLGRHRTGTAQAEDLDGIAQAVARIRLQVERAQAIMASISGDASPARQGEQAGEVRQAMIRAHEFLKPMLDQHGVTTSLTLPDEVLPVSLSPVAVEQVIVNAIQNAIDSLVAARLHGRSAGLLTLTATRQQDCVLCQISDDGAGLTGAIGNDVFSPFFTTKSAQGSLGLGLHISRQIVTNAGGTIDLLPNAGHGATLSFILPMFRGAPPDCPA